MCSDPGQSRRAWQGCPGAGPCERANFGSQNRCTLPKCFHPYLVAPLRRCAVRAFTGMQHGFFQPPVQAPGARPDQPRHHLGHGRQRQRAGARPRVRRHAHDRDRHRRRHCQPRALAPAIAGHGQWPLAGGDAPRARLPGRPLRPGPLALRNGACAAGALSGVHHAGGAPQVLSPAGSRGGDGVPGGRTAKSRPVAQQQHPPCVQSGAAVAQGAQAGIGAGKGAAGGCSAAAGLCPNIDTRPSTAASACRIDSASRSSANSSYSMDAP